MACPWYGPHEPGGSSRWSAADEIQGAHREEIDGVLNGGGACVPYQHLLSLTDNGHLRQRRGGRRFHVRIPDFCAYGWELVIGLVDGPINCDEVLRREDVAAACWSPCLPSPTLQYKAVQLQAPVLWACESWVHWMMSMLLSLSCVVVVLYIPLSSHCVLVVASWCTV